MLLGPMSELGHVRDVSVSKHMDTEGPLQHHWLSSPDLLSESAACSQNFPLKGSTSCVWEIPLY